MTSPLASMAKTVGRAMSGVFFNATLTRPTQGSTAAPYSSFNPGPAGSQTYPCKAMMEDYSDFVRGQNLVGANQVKVMILASTLSTTPKALDRIAIPDQGVDAQVVAANTPGKAAISIDPAKAVWELRCQT